MTKKYVFFYRLGEPVYDFPTGKKVVSLRWRNGRKTLNAYALTDAVKRLCEEVIKRYSASAKLDLIEAFSDGKPISLDDATLSAFVVGAMEREMLKLNN